MGSSFVVVSAGAVDLLDHSLQRRLANLHGRGESIREKSVCVPG
jgi:hypothetical protein